MKRNRSKHCQHRNDDAPGHECSEIRTDGQVRIDGNWYEAKVIVWSSRDVMMKLFAPGILLVAWAIHLFTIGLGIPSIWQGQQTTGARLITLVILAARIAAAALFWVWLLNWAEGAGAPLVIVRRYTIRLGAGAALIGLLLGILLRLR